MSNNITPSEEFVRNLRMNVVVFGKLCDELREYISPDPEAMRRDVISSEKRLAIVLYYLKDQGSLRMTANAFGVSVATVSVSLRKVCGAICKLGPKYIKFPLTTEEIKGAALEFEKKFHFPQVIGCIDGTHIPIRKPQEDPHDFFCYKMKYSLNCQAVCNEKGLFLDVEIQWPGSVHDARVYANSSVNNKFRTKEIPRLYQELVPGYAPVPPLLLGDPAYPLLPNLMKEYPTSRTDKEELFNNSLRAARNQIECAFGRLKARWRILNRPLDVDIQFSCSLIYACFVLHNYCELNNEELSHDTVQHYIDIERRVQSCRHHGIIDKLYSYNSSRGKAVRDAIAQYMLDNFDC